MLETPNDEPATDSEGRRHHYGEVDLDSLGEGLSERLRNAAVSMVVESILLNALSSSRDEIEEIAGDGQAVRAWFSPRDLEVLDSVSRHTGKGLDELAPLAVKLGASEVRRTLGGDYADDDPDWTEEFSERIEVLKGQRERLAKAVERLNRQCGGDAFCVDSLAVGLLDLGLKQVEEGNWGPLQCSDPEAEAA